VANALAHFCCGFIRERDGQNLRWPGFLLGKQVRDAVGKHAGLARTGTCDDEQSLASVFDGSALLRVQPVHERVGIGPANIREVSKKV
jgi:hypothetical protein